MLRRLNLKKRGAAGARSGGGRARGRAVHDVRIIGLLRRHWGVKTFEGLVVTERQFPFRVRADLQRGIEGLFADGAVVMRFCGVRQHYAHEGLDLSAMFVDHRHDPPVVVPPQYDEVDVGDDDPVCCLKNGLWLAARGDLRYAVLLAPESRYGQTTGVRFQVATPVGEAGADVVAEFFENLERCVLRAQSYRGKILSLEKDESYSGRSKGIRVHKLRTFDREQVILPRKTLDLLDRNVMGFVANRDRLGALGQSVKKGLLFYGPPGTGKTHTIHYLAGSLPGHTTLLISAEQVGLLDEYMTLARLLQPSMVVIEDVDLIARDRESMESVCEEVLLNKLLNEMDGLREDAQILFLLTTNRPQALEAALASRPGRVDQAIEFPLPDDEGREKLVGLYSAGVELPAEVAREIVRRTQGVSGAFIKELMRRSVQFHLERARDGRIELADVEGALEEMLFAGGSLNRTLLGAAAEANAGS
jgi:hypothetical protein